MQEIKKLSNSVPPAKQRPLEDITVSNGLFFWLSQNSTNLII